MNIVDIGAGKYKKYASWLTHFPTLKIVSVEPHPDNFSILKHLKNTLSESSQKRLILLNVAITDEQNTTVKFYVNNDKSSGSTLPLVIQNIKKWKYPVGRRFLKTIDTIYVKSMTLEAIFKKYKINVVELLNIDTQGNALNILETLDFNSYGSIKEVVVKSHTPGCVELYKGQCNSYDVSNFLKKRYFEMFNCESYSQGQEQILTFHNEPMKNRRMILHNFSESN